MTMHCRSGGNLEARALRRSAAPQRRAARAQTLAAGARAAPDAGAPRRPPQVMGMMQGKTMGDTFVVLDSFALPVEGAARGGASAERAPLCALTRLPPARPRAQAPRRA
jgi:hypothetical protein